MTLGVGVVRVFDRRGKMVNEMTAGAEMDEYDEVRMEHEEVLQLKRTEKIVSARVMLWYGNLLNVQFLMANVGWKQKQIDCGSVMT